MKKFAKIENNIVINIAVYSDDASIPSGWIDVTDIPGAIGDPISIVDANPIVRPSNYHSVKSTNDGWEINESNTDKKLADEEITLREKEIRTEKIIEGVHGMKVNDFKDYLDAQISTMDVSIKDKEILIKVLKHIGIMAIK